MGSERKISWLDTASFTRLNHACRIVTESLGHAPYLVGSAVDMEKEGVYRDVDVRSILTDEEFDHLFPKESVWSLFCLGVATYLQAVSGLPVDFQVQRQSEANAKYGGPRNPIGTPGRWFAGGGDATPYRAKNETVVAAATSEGTEP